MKPATSSFIRLAATLALGAVLALATGCSGGRSATMSLHAPSAAKLLGTKKAPERVAIWLDEHPQDHIAFVGEIEVHTLSSEHSIRKMQQTAGSYGLDGIYWIDCEGARNGSCTAKGFVYTDGGRPQVGAAPRRAERPMKDISFDPVVAAVAAFAFVAACILVIAA